MKNILNDLSILEGFMASNDVSAEIMRAEEEGMSSPAALCYGDPDMWDPDGDKTQR